MQAGRDKRCTSLEQQLSNVQQELVVAVGKERASSARQQRLRIQHEGEVAAQQAINDSLQADFAALKASEGRLSTEVERLNAVVASMKV